MAETETKQRQINIPVVYKELFLSNYKKFLLASGRISGKTTIITELWFYYATRYPNNDIIILQSTTTEIKDSIINEIESFLREQGFDVGDNPNCEWYIPKAHDKVVHRGEVGKTMFKAITDSNGSNGQRTRGMKAANKLSLVMYEEAQKNKNADVIEHSLATFVRQLDPEVKDAKIIVVGNNETVGHWFVDFANEKRQDPEWCSIYANCYDIWNFLNEDTKKMIEGLKKSNYLKFRQMYLGDIYANTSDVVFPQFDRKYNYKTIDKIEHHMITTLIIGVDHATANDTFAVVPVAILDDGTAQTLEVCYDDPEETNRTLAPSEQCDLLDEFLYFLDNKYGIAYNQLKTILSVDGAAAPFIAQLKHLKHTSPHKAMWKYIEVKAFTAKKKDENMGIIKNAFAYDADNSKSGRKVLTILNEGMYMWNRAGNKHRLAHEIEAQRYKNGKLDPKIKHDLCDALEYGLIPYYRNCYNMSFPIRYINWQKTAHYDDIRANAGVRK